MVIIKELYYGEVSESIVISLKNLGAVQSIANKNEEAMETLDRAIAIIEKLIEQDKIKDKSGFKTNTTEVVILSMAVDEKCSKEVVDLSRYSKYDTILRNVYGSEECA